MKTPQLESNARVKEINLSSKTVNLSQSNKFEAAVGTTKIRNFNRQLEDTISDEEDPGIDEEHNTFDRYRIHKVAPKFIGKVPTVNQVRNKNTVKILNKKADRRLGSMIGDDFYKPKTKSVKQVKNTRKYVEPYAGANSGLDYFDDQMQVGAGGGEVFYGGQSYEQPFMLDQVGAYGAEGEADGKFVDEEFPPVGTSLIEPGVNGGGCPYNQMEWKRVVDIEELNDDEGQLAIFDKNIEPNDIRQG